MKNPKRNKQNNQLILWFENNEKIRFHNIIPTYHSPIKFLIIISTLFPISSY